MQAGNSVKCRQAMLPGKQRGMSSGNAGRKTARNAVRKGKSQHPKNPLQGCRNVDHGVENKCDMRDIQKPRVVFSQKSTTVPALETAVQSESIIGWELIFQSVLCRHTVRTLCRKTDERLNEMLYSQSVMLKVPPSVSSPLEMEAKYESNAAGFSSSVSAFLNSALFCRFI